MNRASYSKGFSEVTRKSSGPQVFSSQGEYFIGRIIRMFPSARRGTMGLADKVVPGLRSNTFLAMCGLSFLPVWAGSGNTLIHITSMMCPWGYASSNVLGLSFVGDISNSLSFFLKLHNSLFSVPCSNGVVGPGHSRNQDTKWCWASKSSPGFENLFQCLYCGVIHLQSWQAWESYGSVTDRLPPTHTHLTLAHVLLPDTLGPYYL